MSSESTTAFWTRTHTCGELRADDDGAVVVLNGWVHLHRDKGAIVFMDVRDRYGVTQVLFDPDLCSAEAFQTAKSCRVEYVVAVRGKVVKRPEGMGNAQRDTGAVEVQALDIQLLTKSEPLPIVLEGKAQAGEDMRLKHRYLDLRRKSLQNNMILRHKVTLATLNYFDENDFVTVETPILTKSTPEGARDYLVPSRVTPGTFYALPQSPQIFKQIMMISGYDRYLQIAKCFRDEDLRADRQPEFTQVDIEMSFITQDILFPLLEGWIAKLWKRFLGVDVQLPIQRFKYADVMERFGVDRPDLRFGLELATVDDLVAGTDAIPLKNALDDGGTVKAIWLPGDPGTTSRKLLDAWTNLVRQFGLGGLLWGKVTGDSVSGAVKKFLTDEQRNAILARLGERNGDATDQGVLMLCAGKAKNVNDAMSRLRVRIAQDKDLIPSDVFAFGWVTDFPMFEWDEEDQRWDAMHHPFTAPKPEHLHLLDSDPGAVLTNAYDMVCNGYEIGGGSIRIHQPDVQSKVFALLGLTEEQTRRKFGFLIDALSYGTPPHGGIAFGLDRLIMLLVGTEAIRDVIAFPKTNRATCLMTEAPGIVEQDQMDDLFLASTVPDSSEGDIEERAEALADLTGVAEPARS